MTDDGLVPPDERPDPLEKLGPDGLRLWRDITADYILRPDELRLLSSAAALADMIARLEKELAKAPLLVPGSRPHMLVANGLIGELTRARTAQASLLRALKLPDDEDDGEQSRTRSEINRQNARSRYAGRYRSGAPTA